MLIATVYSIFYLLLVMLGFKYFNADTIKDYEIGYREPNVSEDLKASLVVVYSTNE